MRVVVIGSAAGHPTPRRAATTSIALWRGEELYLLDAGEGAAAGLARAEAGPEALRAVFISHMHVDHVGGLAMLLQMLQLQKRRRPLLVGLPPEGVEGLMGWLRTCYLRPEWLGFELEIAEVEEGRGYEQGGVAVEAIPTRHLEGFVERLRDLGEERPGQAFSYAVEADGRRLLYSSDLAFAWEAPERLRRADLAIIEIAHFSPEELGGALAGLPLPRLVLNHVPWALEGSEREVAARVRGAGYGGQVYVAHDGDEFEV